MTTFRLPDLGEGLTESTIVEWQVAEGDTVAWGDVLAQVETAKAVVELPSPHDGRVRKLHVEAGDTVDVGAPIIDFDLGPGDEDPSPDADADADADDEAPAEASAPAGSSADDAVADTDEQDAQDAAEGADGRVSVLVGSVKLGGRERPARSPRTFAQQPFVRDDRGGSPRASRREPVSGLRRRTAEAMVASAFTAPHASCFLQVDVTETTQIVSDLKGGDSAPSFLAMTCRAIVSAAGRSPGVNATYHSEPSEIEYHEAVNLGIAVATDRGLVVASVDDADRLDATELTAAIAQRAAAARDGSIGPEALTGSTLTVSNVGVFGVDGGTPILNPGQSAIIAVGAVRHIPWEHDGQIALRDVCTLTVSFDHRVIDGREASRFLADVGGMLARPGLALARG
ncbi:dihydrolipoamide acetyltransferase component of pyruvate dehydrogenase complex [Microbacterium faecale]|uniref:Dihydrolipoamide acetyltransferase component of pyruvate dehydrogenase complex n=1 Tax=Microbacterium faecale TaxID=1804630 RepID=A0A916YF61_9MICO|nr:dihydrolipoamide acetyltransferase family protein [Microbacterium faecale]GGD40899.1 dihydrolipoamide acetyltransferase component of pyruvate dehydrogenase complex [Microbacterium faecale]